MRKVSICMVGALVRLVVYVAGACFVASLSRTALSVTPMAITYRSGPVRIRLSVADMETCAPVLAVIVPSRAA